METKVCTDCEVDKPILEFGKMKQSKDGLHPYCKLCISLRCKEYRERNKEAVRERKSKYSKTERGKAKKRESYYRNIDNAKAYHKAKFQKNKDKIYARIREYRPKYFQNNPGLSAAYSSLYRGLKHNASSILTKDLKAQIREIHRVCKLKSEEDGVKYHVDHVIPLKNDRVCGLNVPWNLQILTQTENHSKINKFDGTYENESWRNDLPEVKLDIQIVEKL